MESFTTIYLIVGVIAIALSILITRLLGAWMFRITEVIQLQKDILNELRRQRTGQEYQEPRKSSDRVNLLQKADPKRKPLS